MIEKIKKFIEKEAIYRDLIKRVYDNPYEEKRKAFAALNYNEEELKNALAELENEMILLSLTTHSSAGLESRILRVILMVNPDLENDLGKLLDEL
ncbi:MAG TPA: hypothetical protein PLA73_02970 [Sedimentibacter sp.]|mgnify:CR=1 FL=1|nr:hypothetical protein [Sedimentibacter sp.]